MGFFIWYFGALAIANKFQTDRVSVQEMPANRTFVLRHWRRLMQLRFPGFPYSLSARQEESPWNAGPRIEPGLGLEQASAPELWCTLTDLRCTLLSFSVPSWATLYPNGFCCTLLSYAVPCWATLHTIELRSTLLRYAAPFWARRN